MDKMNKTFAGYQTQSLIEFLLGDETRPGWLDRQSRGQSSNALVSRNEGASPIAPGSVAA